MKKVSIRDAKVYLSRLLERVSSGKVSLREAKAELGRLADHIYDGEEIVITRDGEAIARLIPFED
jgi:prevent-host-death family protein